MTGIRFSKRTLLLAACASAAIAAPAYAQDAAGAEEADETVVIVTATRRETALQATPVAVTALNAGQLQDAGVRDIRDLTQIAPSLQVPVSENSSSVTARIRGIGTQGSNPGLESSVGVFVDGVYRARNGVAFGDLGELQAVEVLRGPQGTLFGRNTSAGLINVNTRKPQFEFGTSGDVTFGNYGAFGIGAGITGPFSDTLAGRLYIAARSRDGFVTINNGLPGQDESHDQGYLSVRGQLLWQPNDDFSLRLIADTASRNESCCAAVVWTPDVRVPSTTAILNRIAPNALATRRGTETLDARANRSYNQTIEDQGLSAEATWETGVGTLTSVTAWRNWNWIYGQDADFSGADVLYRDKGERSGNEFTTITQELRLAGSVGQLDWLVGAFYSDETITRKDRFRIGADYATYIGSLLGPAVPAALGGPFIPTNTAVPLATLANVPVLFQIAAGLPTAIRGNFAAGGGTSDEFQQEATSIALFTHNIYNVTDDLSVTLGLRYTAEDKTFRADYSTTGNGACSAFERALGLNPVANAGALAPVVGALCAPWMRSGLDAIDHRQAKEEREWSGIFSVAYRVTDGINTYASYSRGYKAGGFNLDRAFSDIQNGVITSVVSGAPGAQTVRNPDTSFAPETVDAFEIGVKTQWLDRQITANFALFHQTFENFQLNTFNGISFVVTAVPEVVAQGVEMDFVLRPAAIDGLTITGGVAYSDTQYTDNLGSVANPRSFLGQNPNLYLIQGKQLTSSPEWTIGTAINYEREVLNGEALLKTYFDLRRVTEYNTGSNLDPRKIQNGYALINGRVSLSTTDERWTIELWGRNLTDERYAQITFDSPLQGDSPQINPTGGGNFAPRTINSQLNAFVGEPRMYGITIRWAH